MEDKMDTKVEEALVNFIDDDFQRLNKEFGHMVYEALEAPIEWRQFAFTLYVVWLAHCRKN